MRVFGLIVTGSSLCLFGAVTRRDFGPQLTKRFLDFLAHCIGHGRNWASLIRRQLSGGHDDALDVRARLGENALHVKFFAHGMRPGGHSISLQTDMRGDLPPSVLQPKGKDYVMTLSSGIVILAGGLAVALRTIDLAKPLQPQSAGWGIQKILVYPEIIGQQQMKGTRNA